MAYIEFEPKSSYTIKYSQPFELKFFYVIHFKIKCHKSSTTRIY